MLDQFSHTRLFTLPGQKMESHPVIKSVDWNKRGRIQHKGKEQGRRLVHVQKRGQSDNKKGLHTHDRQKTHKNTQSSAPGKARNSEIRFHCLDNKMSYLLLYSLVAGHFSSMLVCREKKETSEKYIVYFQPYSNTYKPTQELDRLYREALCHPDIAGIAVGTRPDCVDRDKISVLAALARETYVSIEYGVQTIHDTTLHAINRGHDFASLLQAMKITRNQGLDICFHVILGLPGETREQMRQTATTLGTLGYNSLKIHNLHVVKNTSLEAEFKKGTLVLPTLEEHASLAVDFLERTPRSVVIQRLCGDAPRDFFCLFLNKRVYY